jgi:hypothetical protein
MRYASEYGELQPDFQRGVNNMARKMYRIILVLIFFMAAACVVSAGYTDTDSKQVNLPVESRENLSRSLAESLHVFRWNPATGSWSAWNGLQDISIRTMEDGNVLFCNTNGSFGMRFTGIGRGEAIIPAGAGRPEVKGRKIDIPYGDASLWYLNNEEGIEQGMIVAARPEGDGLMRVSFALQGTLVPAKSGNAVIFSNSNGSVFRYSGLKISDSAGHSFPGTICLEGNNLIWEIDDTDATFPLIIDPSVTQDKIISASDKTNNDLFGYSVSVSYGVAVVGAPDANSGEDEIGKAYVLYRNEGGADQWGEIKTLIASDAADGDEFGYSVSISGTTILVGAPRADYAGIINCGQAYLFDQDAGGDDNWGQVKIIHPGVMEEGDRFGYSVSLSGDTAVVGAPWADSYGTDMGQVYIFYRDQGGADNWGQVRVRAGSDRSDGDNFGQSVSISDTSLIVGAPLAGSGGTKRGQAYMFYKDHDGGDNWGQVKILSRAYERDGDKFGSSVDVSGDMAIVGAMNASRYGSSGLRYQCGEAEIFYKDQDGADQWGSNMRLSPPEIPDYAFFGKSVAIQSERAVVGAYLDNSEGVVSGQAYVYGKDTGGADNWGQEEIVKGTDTSAGDWYGYSVSLTEYYNFATGWSAVVMTGAPNADSGGTDRGQVYVFNVHPKTKIGVFRNGFWILDKNGNLAWDSEPSDKVAGFGTTGDIPVVGNWDHTKQADKIGVFRNGLWLLDYNGNYQWDASDKSVSLGTAGDIPVVGDWNNDGDKEIGVFRNGFWILDKNGNFRWDGEPSDEVAGFGTAGDIPVVGDWNGNLQDKIGVYRNGFWILDRNGNFQWDGTGDSNDLLAAFGTTGDVPVVRDWNGDGDQEIAVFRPSTGQWLIDQYGNFQWDGTGSGLDVIASLGQTGDTAVSGKWSGAESDTMGVFREGFWILDFNGNYEWDGPGWDKVTGIGTTGDTPVTGKFL